MTISGGEGYGGDMGKAARTLGMGAAHTPGDLGAKMLEAFLCNISDMPVILQQRSMFTGPIPDNALNTLFSANMDLLSFGKQVPGAAEVSLNGISNGQASTHFLVCGVFAHFTPPPFNFTVPGGAWTAPTQNAAATPVIPDAWSEVDQTVTTGALGLQAGQTLTQAYMDYGNWVQEGFYEWARAYNWLWTNGEQTTLLNWPLRHIAKVIPNPQTDTSAQATINIMRYVAQCNQYYRQGGGAASGNGPAADAIFLPRNARRNGASKFGGATAMSTFVPDTSAWNVEPTYGGPGVQELGCNTEYFRLPTAIVFPRSVSLNMSFQVVSTTAQQRVQKAFSMTDGVGGTPPGIIGPDQFVTAADFSGTGASPVFTDLTKDAAPQTYLSAQEPWGVAIFKIGDWWVTVGLVGYEMNESDYDKIKAANGDIRNVWANAGHKIAFWNH